MVCHDAHDHVAVVAWLDLDALSERIVKPAGEFGKADCCHSAGSGVSSVRFLAAVPFRNLVFARGDLGW